MSSSNQHGLQFSQFLKLSLGLLLFSGFLTVGHSYDWSFLGIVGWWAIPFGVALAVLLFWVVIYWISHRLLGLNTFYQLTEELHVMCKHFTWPQIIIISILAGISEELLFRGALQSWLANSIGVYTGLVLSSLIFGLLHAMSLYYFVFAFVMSLFLGSIFHLTQSMLLVVTIHTAYDILALGVIAKYPEILGVSKGSKGSFKV